MFRRKKNAGLTPDPTLGNATARAALEAAGSGWRELDAVLRPASADERELAVSVVTEQPGWPAWVDEWTAAQPDDALAWTVRGAKDVMWAWEARGGSTAVGEAAWIEFQRRLGAAEEDLSRAVELDPGDPTPRVFRLIAARGLELDAASIRSRFDEVIEIDPLHRAAHNHMVQALAPKWGGSNDAMFEFANAVTTTAPDGTSLHAVVAEAHIERWLWTMIGDGGNPGAAERYFQRDNVRIDLVAAAERSVLSPAYVPVARQAWDHQLFAFSFWQTGDHDMAAELFARVGDVVSELPWGYLGKPGEVFQAVRTEVLANTTAS